MNINAITSCTSMINRIASGNEIMFMAAFSELLDALNISVVENCECGTDAYDVQLAIGLIGELISMITRNDNQIRIRNQVLAVLVALDLDSVTCSAGI